jgi:hypothetical protein
VRQEREAGDERRAGRRAGRGRGARRRDLGLAAGGRVRPAACEPGGRRRRAGSNDRARCARTAGEESCVRTERHGEGEGGCRDGVMMDEREKRRLAIGRGRPLRRPFRSARTTLLPETDAGRPSYARGRLGRSAERGRACAFLRLASRDHVRPSEELSIVLISLLAPCLPRCSERRQQLRVARRVWGS